MELSSLLERVRKLVAVAEHPETPPHEAKLAREMADSLMLKHAIDEALLDQTRPAPLRAKPATINVDLAHYANDLVAWISRLAELTARHCRCLIRSYTGYNNGVYHSTVYGYESDLRYFEILYPELRLHMLGALRPGWNKTETLEENCFRLHSAGYNWLEIAELDGWAKANPARYPEVKIPY